MKNKTMKVTKFDVMIILLIIVSVLLLNIIFSRVSGSFEASCNTGKVGLNYSGHWESYVDGLGYNETELISDFIKINGIDNLNCNMKGSFNAPWWKIKI